MNSGTIHIKDEFGNDVYLGQAGEVLMPAVPIVTNFREQLRHVKQLEIKHDDVILSGYPKTGSHWAQEILYMLVNGTTDYDTDDIVKRIGFFRETPGSLAPGSPPRVLICSNPFHLLPKQVVEKGVKVVYLQRNPKDTWVSLYNHTRSAQGTLHYGGTWDQFFKLMMSLGYWYGDWFDYVLNWEQAITKYQGQVPFHIVVYEDLKRDPLSVIEKLDQFLGYNRGKDFHKQVSEACSFGKLKQEKDASFPEDLRRLVWRDESAGFFRKGEVGDWKNWFTVAQNEQFDEIYKQRMAESKLHYTFEL